MLSSPSEFARHIHSDVTGKKLAIDLIRLMPDAMTYTYAPGQPQITSPHLSARSCSTTPPTPIGRHPAPQPRHSPAFADACGSTPKPDSSFGWKATSSRASTSAGACSPISTPAARSRSHSDQRRQVTAGSSRSFVERHHASARSWSRSIDVRTPIQASDFQVLPSPLTYTEAIRILLATPLPTR